MPLTRRHFLTRIGQAGGFGAAYLGMQTLGLLPTPDSAAQTIHAAPNSGNGTSVVILGAGIAGLVAAYELRALGYTVTVLEALPRTGGRNWTVRAGTEINSLDGATQTCTFDPGHYQNVGPGRLPSNHRTMLNYCQKLKVPLEVEINTSRSSKLQNDAANNARPVIQRQAINDTRGHVSELLSKCIRGGALDGDLTKEDRARMIDFLHTYGPLTQSGAYIGSDRAGFAIQPGAGEIDGTLADPLSMHTLLDAAFWEGMLYEEENDWQATMFQPVGGMDTIPYAFARELGDIIHHSTPVTALHKTAQGVRVTYTQNNATHTLEADFCFCAMPLIQLRKIPADLGPAHRKVVDQCTYDGYYKIAWESRRFWEQEENIYGGLEFVAQGPSPIWLPSWGLFSDRGVLVSGYALASGTPFNKLSLDQKFAASRASVERLHPGRGHELEKPIYLGWDNIPYIEGSWISSYGPNQPQLEQPDVIDLGHRRGGTFANPGYTTLLQPDGPIYFIGDHVSYLVGWQEGAALSSLRAINMLSERVKSTRP